MKLYYHPVSTVCRPIMLFAEEHALDLDYQVVDLFRGEQLGAAFAALNPSCQVPVLVDGDYCLTESATILRYLANECGSPGYPTDLRRRCRVDERLDWFNTGLYRDLGYGFIYPQVYPNHRREDSRVNAAVLAWGRDKANVWLRILDAHLIGPTQPFVCGDDISIADYFGAGVLSLGEVIGLDYSVHQNVSRWFQRMKARSSWAKTHENFYAKLVEPLRGGSYAAL